jgi:diketogulonate reductase-like aldo/keto reductase
LEKLGTPPVRVCQKWDNIFRIEVLAAIAEKHGKSVAQVILRWLAQHGGQAL